MIHRKTRSRGVTPDIPYYVGRDFNARYGRDKKLLRSAEEAVEHSYVVTLERSCSQQKQTQKRSLYMAQQSRNDRKIKEAYASCANAALEASAATMNLPAHL